MFEIHNNTFFRKQLSYFKERVLLTALLRVKHVFTIPPITTVTSKVSKSEVHLRFAHFLVCKFVLFRLAKVDVDHGVSPLGVNLAHRVF